MVGAFSLVQRLIETKKILDKMENTPIIDLELDFRDYADSPKTPKEFFAFWQMFAPRMIGKNLESGVTREIEHQPRGTFRLSVMSSFFGSALITENTKFAIRSVLEKSPNKRICAACRRAGQDKYGIYSCAVCFQEKQDDWLCDDHAVILHGGMMLEVPPRANCQNHAPLCFCRQRAVYWCEGPGCEKKVAWCGQHCKRHPNDSGIFYCPNCYERVFPACNNTMCKNTATGFCEFIEVDKSCGRRLCSRHISRWQIYGPHKIGLGLCQEHRRIKELNETQIIHQMVAATAVRKLNEPRGFHSLPSLQSVNHIFLKTQKHNFGLPAINQMFVEITSRTGNQTPIQRKMKELLERHKQIRQQNFSRDQEEKQQGLLIFQKLKYVMTQNGQGDIAEKLGFSDYRPNSKMIFIHLPTDFRARFIGRGGSNVKQLETLIGGFIIKFEK